MRFLLLVLLVGCQATTQSQDHLASVTPVSESPAAQSAVQVRCSLMIDFPGAKIHAYKDIDNGHLVAHLKSIDRWGLGDSNVIPVLHSDTIMLTDGVPPMLAVRDALDNMIESYNRLPDSDAKFDPLDTVRAQSVFQGTEFEDEPHYVRTVDDLEWAAAQEGATEQDRQNLAQGRDISCVRFVWVEGRLLAIYNYSLVVQNARYDPSKLASFKVAAPRFCAVAEFWVDEV